MVDPVLMPLAQLPKSAQLQFTPEALHRFATLTLSVMQNKVKR